tara:strand:- start:417 stop:578 length:162 start_codon:yes stop_codon:yes gene_type:complete
MNLIMSLLMVLVGFILALLGVIVFIHSADHALLGVILSFGGICSMFGGLPNYE